MVKDYAEAQDIIDSGRNLSADEMNIAKKKISEASAMIRMKARGNVMYDELTQSDIDKMQEENEDLVIVAKSIVVSCVIRYLNDSKTDPAVTQFSQAAAGYSISGTYAASGARVSIWDSEWKMLGLKRQHIGSLEMYDYADKREDGTTS